MSVKCKYTIVLNISNFYCIKYFCLSDDMNVATSAIVM